MEIKTGERIKIIRKSKKISQKKLAETIGCATVSIQKYESNERTPSLEVLNKIAAALGVTVSEILGESLSSKNLTLESFNTEELLDEIKRRTIKYGV